MDRGAWWAIVHEVAKVRHELATEHTCSKIGTKLKKIQPCFVGSQSSWVAGPYIDSENAGDAYIT